MQFISNLRESKRKQSLTLSKFVTIMELPNTKLIWLNQKNLETDEDFANVKSSLRIYKYSNVLLHSHGRMKNASLPYKLKCPILLHLHRTHCLTKLIVLGCHYKTNKQQPKTNIS